MHLPFTDGGIQGSLAGGGRISNSSANEPTAGMLVTHLRDLLLGSVLATDSCSSYLRAWLIFVEFREPFLGTNPSITITFFSSNLSAKKFAPSKIVRLRFPSVLSCFSVPGRLSWGIRHSVTSMRDPEVTFGVSASIKIYGNYLSYLSGEVRELIPRSFLLVCFSFCFVLFCLFVFFIFTVLFFFTSYKIWSFSLTSFYDSFASLTH